jgi:hypothetical protein
MTCITKCFERSSSEIERGSEQGNRTLDFNVAGFGDITSCAIGASRESEDAS